MSPAARKDTTIDVDGVEVRISSPDKIVFPEPGLTKLDIVRYYLAVADGALRGAAGRPMVLKRFVKGISQEAFFQKRVPENHPEFIDTATLHYARGTSAEETVIRDAAGLAWVVNLGCLDLNPHPVRAEDLDHPDELRVDLDPMPGVGWSQIVDVAMVAREVLDDHGLVGWPKTSGSRGLHILVRIAPEWDFRQVRLAAETLAREVENRAPGLATARWWKEERGESVFVDFNQNAKDRTVASAYSIRPLADARVSTPLDWDEVRVRRPEEFTVLTVPDRFAERGDPHAGIDDAVGIARCAARAGRGARTGGEAAPRVGRVRAAGFDDAADRGRARPRPSPRPSRRSSAWKAQHPEVGGAAASGRRARRRDARVELALVPRASQPAACARGRPSGAGRADRRLRPVGRQGVAWSARNQQIVVELPVVAEEHRVGQLGARDLGEGRRIQHQQE